MNYIRTLSKSSLLSSSSLKSIIPSEEVTKLHAENEKLKQTVESLKLTVEGRDAAIGTLAREKEKLYVELKTAQRTNRNLHQQLEDERYMHSKEKEFLIQEINRIANKNEPGSSNNLLSNQRDVMDNILREEMRSKDEVICNICTKYLKIKKSKMLLLRDFKELQSESQKACENIIMLLEENKKSLDYLLQKLIEHSNVPINTKKYFKILRHNARLHYENTQLKVRLTSSINKHFMQNRNFNENSFEKTMFRKKNNYVKPHLFKQYSKMMHHENFDDSKTFLCRSTRRSIYKMTFPYFKSNSDTCLALSRL